MASFFYTQHETVTETYEECCDNRYILRNKECIPTCIPSCIHGLCTAPNTCTCHTGFEGSGISHR